MDDRLKQRLVGAVVLVLAAVIFVPMLLDQEDEPPLPSARMVPIEPLEGTDKGIVPLRSAPVAADPLRASPPPEPARVAEPAPGVAKLPPKPAPAPAPAKAAVKSGFAVQLGTFSKAGNAKGLRDGLIAKGYKAFVKSSGAVTRVYVGPQSSRAEAQKMLEKLLAEIELQGIVVKYPG
jgi:DedD protein